MRFLRKVDALLMAALVALGAAVPVPAASAPAHAHAHPADSRATDPTSVRHACHATAIAVGGVQAEPTESSRGCAGSVSKSSTATETSGVTDA